MIKNEIYTSIKEIYNNNKNKITQHDILSALTEELGEYSRAVRIEDNASICHNKELKESSKIEIIDLILVCIEAYISRGGTYSEMIDISYKKLEKWGKLWEENYINSISKEVMEARKNKVCRICRKDIHNVNEPVTLNYGKEYAHSSCLEAQTMNKNIELEWTEEQDQHNKKSTMYGDIKITIFCNIIEDEWSYYLDGFENNIVDGYESEEEAIKAAIEDIETE